MANENENYNLYTEKIKEKPSVKYKKLLSLLRLAALAAFAGVIAGLVFVCVVGIMQEIEQENSDDRQQITIPMDDPTVSADNGTDAVGDGSGEGNGVLSGNQVGNEPEDSVNVYNQVAELVEDIEPMMVQVKAINRNEDPLFSVVENTDNYPGIFIGDNEVEYLILTDYAMNSVDMIEVIFAEGSKAEATMVMADAATGLAVVAVEHDAIPETMRGAVKIAEMGNSYMVKQGSLAVAIGNMYGIEAAVDFGAVVSTKEMSYEADLRHGLLYTNMSGVNGNSGFVFNDAGQLIGNISAGHSAENIVAYGISDVKIRIQNMINGKKIAYLGIIGRDIDEATSKEYGMPAGVYVASTENNSPAYYSGIMTGDVVIDINGRTISNAYSVERAMCEFAPKTDVVVKVMRKGSGRYVPIEFTITLSEK